MSSFGVIFVLAAVVFAVLGIVSKIKKKPGAKRNFLIAGAAFLFFVIAVSSGSAGKDKAPAASPAPSPSAASPSASAAALAADPQAEAEAKREAEEAEAKAAAEEAERKGKSFDANGTFIVNEEVKPGLYRAEEDITYWARLKGFSGELDDILANGTPSGPAIVEIKAKDAGFQTSGSGTWTKIDETYKPEIRTEFGDGTYIVGKDIKPGTYKSDGNVVYWARLKNFAGGLDAIAANGTPNGPEIVNIKASDKGFESSGGGTWTKIK